MSRADGDAAEVDWNVREATTAAKTWWIPEAKRESEVCLAAEATSRTGSHLAKAPKDPAMFGHSLRRSLKPTATS